MKFYDQHPEFEWYGEQSLTTKDGYQIEIVYDQVVFDPSYEFMDYPVSFGIDLSNHRDFRGGEYGTACPVSVPEFLWWNEWHHTKDTSHFTKEEIWDFIQFDKNYHWLPVYMYEHSGCTIRTVPFNDRWDSGCAGVIFIRKADAIAEDWRGIKKVRNAEKRSDLILEMLTAEIDRLNCFFTGEIYGFTVTDKYGEHVDSCWEFVGDAGREEACRQALEAIEYHNERALKRHLEITKQYIKNHVPLESRVH